VKRPAISFEIRGRDGPFLCRQTAVPGTSQEVLAHDPWQKTRGYRGCNQAVPPDQEEVCGRRLGGLAALIEKQGIVKPLASRPL
jgi:hypothetical protein